MAGSSVNVEHVRVLPTDTRAAATDQPTGAFIPTAAVNKTKRLFHLPLTKTCTYTWKTDKNWRNTCRVFRLGLADGTSHDVNVRFPR